MWGGGFALCALRFALCTSRSNFELQAIQVQKIEINMEINVDLLSEILGLKRRLSALCSSSLSVLVMVLVFELGSHFLCALCFHFHSRHQFFDWSFSYYLFSFSFSSRSMLSFSFIIVHRDERRPLKWRSYCGLLAGSLVVFSLFLYLLYQ
jgi:hypothetical protein